MQRVEKLIRRALIRQLIRRVFAQDQAPDDSQVPDDTHVQERQCAPRNVVRKSSAKAAKGEGKKKEKKTLKNKDCPAP